MTRHPSEIERLLSAELSVTPSSEFARRVRNRAAIQPAAGWRRRWFVVVACSGLVLAGWSASWLRSPGTIAIPRSPLSPTVDPTSQALVQIPVRADNPSSVGAPRRSLVELERRPPVDETARLTLTEVGPPSGSFESRSPTWVIWTVVPGPVRVTNVAPVAPRVTMVEFPPVEFTRVSIRSGAPGPPVLSTAREIP